VEMALVLPLLVAVVFGIIDFARLFNGLIETTQAAREGVRLVAVSSADTSSDYYYNDAAVTNRAQQAAPNPAFGPSAGAVTVVRRCADKPAPDATAAVSVSFGYDPVFYSFLKKTYTRTAVMRCGG